MLFSEIFSFTFTKISIITKKYIYYNILITLNNIFYSKRVLQIKSQYTNLCVKYTFLMDLSYILKKCE